MANPSTPAPERVRPWRLVLSVLLGLGWFFSGSGEGWTRTRTVVRVTVGDHPYFGRVVLDAPGLAHVVRRDGDRVWILFPEEPAFGILPPAPRNVLALRPVPAGVELTLPRGARMRASRLGGKVVIDIDDTPPENPPPNLPPNPGLGPVSPTPDTRVAAKSMSSGTVSDTAASRLPGPWPPGSRPVSPDSGNLAGAPPFIPLAAKPEPRPVASAAPVPEKPPPDVSRPAVPAPARMAPKPPPPDPRPAATTPSATPSAGTESRPSATLAREPAKSVVAPPALEPVAPKPATPRPTAPDNQSDTPPADKVEPRPTPESRLALSPSEPAQGPAQDAGAEKTANPSLPPAEPPPAEPPPAEPLAVGEATQVWPVTRDALPSGPVALIATRGRPPEGLSGASITLPFTGPVGAALLSQGGDITAVFDERRPVDMSALRDDTVFGGAVVTIHPAATVIRLRAPPGHAAMLIRAQDGWRLSVVAASPRPAPLTPVFANGILTFAAEAPGQVVAILDPKTGGTLLVGTQRKPGQGVAVERRTAEFHLPATGQGIVVEPLSDAIGLRITQAGFVLNGQRGGLAVSAPMPMAEAALDAARLTRRYGFPGQATEVLMRRVRQQAVVAATAPPMARGPKRRALAESLIGLGLAAEAQTLLRVTAKDDPAEAASPDTAGLAAIAALLAGRPREAGDIQDPRLDGTDEIALWRALRMAMTDEGSPAAAAMLASTAPLLFTYPEELRRRVLPLALETMVLGGAAAPAARLLAQREHDPALAYARALLKQATGDKEEALKQFDAVANTRSPYDHARAAVRATELRLAMGKLDANAAAEALEKRLYAWRGDQRDRALRERIAELRLKAGAWRPALALLRSTKAAFPAQGGEIDRRLKEAFATLSRDAALDAMPPTELIGLLEENTELMPEGPDGEPMRARLAEKLMALDLPKRADAVLTKLLRAAPIGPGRAGFGATLATLRLREGDADGALLALSESSSADTPAPVRARRALIAARVAARRGDVRDAVEALSGVTDREAEELRASILEKANDWPAARDALATLMARAVPEGAAPLDETQRGIVLRLAAAAAHAGDDATLGLLREKIRPRIGTGREADLFRLLTAAPVRGAADLGRARAEIGLARAVTAAPAPPASVPKPP